MSRKAYIVGTGRFLPAKELTNDYLVRLTKPNGDYVCESEKENEKIQCEADVQKMIKKSKEFCRGKVGIEKRRQADEDTSASDLAYEACINAMKAAEWSKDDVDGVILGTVTPDYVFPNTAALVADRLGLSNVPAYDFEAGCSGFVYGIIQAKAFIEAGIFDNMLVIGVECLTKITDYERRDCFIFGDGAGAVAVSSKKHETGLSGEISSYDWGSDGSMGKELIMPAGGSRNPASSKTVEKREHYIRMNGQAIFKEAVNHMKQTALNALANEEKLADDIPLRKKNLGEVILNFPIFDPLLDPLRKKGWIAKKPNIIVNLLIPHQANKTIIMATAKRLGIDMENVCVNIDKYGNTSSASIPIALDEAFRAGRIKEKDIVVLSAFGAGLTWGAVVLKWSRFVPKRRFINIPKSDST